MYLDTLMDFICPFHTFSALSSPCLLSLSYSHFGLRCRFMLLCVRWPKIKAKYLDEKLDLVEGYA